MNKERIFNGVDSSEETESEPSLEEDVWQKALQEKIVVPYLQEGRVQNIKPLGGGRNDSFFVNLANGARGVFKPASGERIGRRDTRTKPGTYFKRERAAYLADCFFDFDLVPPHSHKRGEWKDWKRAGIYRKYKEVR